MEFHDQVFDAPGDVETRLVDLGLSLEIVQRAVDEGTLSRLQVTANHPVTAGGTMLYFEAVRSLRDQLIPLSKEGWEKLDDQNRALVFNKRRSLLIGVASGDWQTGMRNGNPTTRSAKGQSTKRAVVTNQYYFEAFEDFFARPIPEQIRNMGVLWLLLVHVDMRSGQVRSELSRPVSWGEEKSRPVLFQPRIILPPINFDPNWQPVKNLPPAPTQTPEVIVEIKRRG